MRKISQRDSNSRWGTCLAHSHSRFKLSHPIWSLKLLQERFLNGEQEMVGNVEWEIS